MGATRLSDPRDQGLSSGVEGRFKLRLIGGPSGTAACERRLNWGMSRIAFCARITPLVSIICIVGSRKPRSVTKNLVMAKRPKKISTTP